MASAGCLFIENNMVLCGYAHRYASYTGFGGKALALETPLETAARETIEELYGINPSSAIIEDFCKVLKECPFHERKGYFFVHCNFSAIQQFYEILLSHQAISPYYKELPRNIEELVSLRRPDFDAEIYDFAIKPVDSDEIHRYLKKDCFMIVSS